MKLAQIAEHDPCHSLKTTKIKITNTNTHVKK